MNINIRQLKGNKSDFEKSLQKKKKKKRENAISVPKHNLYNQNPITKHILSTT